VAVATFQLAPHPSGSTIPILINSVAVSSGAGVTLPASGTGSAITVTAPVSPSVPGNVIATAVSTSQINVSWSPSTDPAGPVAGYIVYRNGSQVASVTAGTTYSDTGLSPNTAYSYTVVAYDAAGNHSAVSSAAGATTLPLAVSIATTVTTNPAGLGITVDGQSYTAPQAFSWAPASSHTLAVSSPQSSPAGTLYAWTNWTDGGALAHTITASNTTTTYTANFNPLSTNPNPPPANPNPPPANPNPPTTSPSPVGPALVGYWKLNEPSGAMSFADASGAGNTGGCSAYACPTLGFLGKSGTAASFNGMNSQIIIPDSPSLRLNQFTIALWVYPTQEDFSYQPILAKDDRRGGNRNYGLFIVPNSMQVRYAVWGSDCVTHFAANSVGQLTPNAWNYVVFTYDGHTETLYLNGVLDSTNPASTSSLCQAGTSIQIGRESSAFQPFNGILDDIRIYNQALSATGLSNLYNSF